MDELRTALELANDDELEVLADLLFRPKFNPLDYLYAPDIQDIQNLSRPDQLDVIESRFRYLAADGLTVLNRRSHRVTYRQVLLKVCRHLKVRHGSDWSTEDLEAEVFLQLIERCWERLSLQERRRFQQTIGASLANLPEFKALPTALQQQPVSLLLKGGSALAVTSVLSPWLQHQIASQFALQLARYELAKRTLLRGGASAATYVQNRVALSMASRGMAASATRYGAVRTALAWAGPVIWGWFLADLGWRTVATNYGRVIPAVFALAQIRLTRTAAPVYC